MTDDLLAGDRIQTELGKIRGELRTMHATVHGINRALIGDLGGYTGLLTRMGMAEHRIDRLEVASIEKEKRIENLEDWRAELKNKAIGIAIGLDLGSAGIGATVGAIVTKVFGG